jgi:hypothetical protein
MIQLLYALPLLIHGVAHISGFRASWTAHDSGFKDRPWILSAGGTLQSPIGRVFGILWLVASAAFLVAGLGLLFSQLWWPTVAVPAAILSLVVILPWWNAVPLGSKIGAAFDVLVLVVLFSPLRDSLLTAVA